MRKQSRFIQSLLQLVLPALSAVLLTFILYLVLTKAPQLKGTYLYELITQRGNVQWATMGLAFWTASALTMKFVMILFDKRGWNHLPFEEDGARIMPEDASGYLTKIKEGPKAFRNSLLGKRIVMGLDNFRAHGMVQEVMDAVNTQSDVDSRESDNSYTIVKIFVASIPILGFIGTVIGIGSAVGGFGDALQGMKGVSEIQSSLKNVTSGLSVAFDTTLLALVVSIILMLPLGMVQQYEERGLTQIDDYVNNEFINRLSEGGKAGGQAIGVEASGQLVASGGSGGGPAVDDGLTPEERRAMGSSFSGEMESLMTQIRTIHREQVETMQQTSDAINEHSRNIQEVFNGNSQYLQAWGQQFSENLQASQGAMEQSQTQLAGRLENGQAALNEMSAKQQEATSSYLQALQSSSEQLHQSTEQWKSREAELLEHFDQRASENLNAMTSSVQSLMDKQSAMIESTNANQSEASRQAAGAFQDLMSKQSAMIEATQAVQYEAARQADAIKDVIPNLAKAAETQLADTREKLESDSDAFSRQLMNSMQNVFEQAEKRNQEQAKIINAMQEQASRQAEILREFHDRQKAEHQSLDQLTGQWNDLAVKLEKSSVLEGDKKKGWLPWN